MNIPLRIVHFIVYTFYIKRKKTTNKYGILVNEMHAELL